MLGIIVQSGEMDITDDVVIRNGEHYGAIAVSKLRDYDEVSITVTYTTVEGVVHTAVCILQS